MISNDAVSEIAAFCALAPDTDSTTVGLHLSAPARSNLRQGRLWGNSCRLSAVARTTGPGSETVLLGMTLRTLVKE